MHDEHCGHDHHHHDHHDHHEHGPRGHAHEDDVKGVSLSTDRPIDGRLFTVWLDKLLAERGPDILRAKGIIDVKGEDRRLVFRAVHMILEGDLQRPWGANERRWSRAVFIGRTNMVEFAFGTTGLNPHYGTPKNPWDRRTGRVPGGSSSGAAVAQADGMCVMALESWWTCRRSWPDE